MSLPQIKGYTIEETAALYVRCDACGEIGLVPAEGDLALSWAAEHHDARHRPIRLLHHPDGSWCFSNPCRRVHEAVLVEPDEANRILDREMARR